MKKKVAVVLINLGGPDSKEAIKPFLMNFFMDKNIIRLPLFLRYFIAKLIASKRSKREAGESYGELGNKSPLLENTKLQAEALQKVLQGDENCEFKTFVCMRYWHPMSPQVVREIHDWGADQIMFLPLYPQFSTTTTWSSLEAWDKAMFSAGYNLPTSIICCYPFDNGFIQASVENIKQEYAKAQENGHTPRVLFSAHGLPEKIIKDGDPYQWQCEQSAQKIADALNIENLDWAICYQSRVGRMKWIAPSIEEELERAGRDEVSVLIYPHAFTQEHVETLVELDIEYKEKAEEIGIKGYYRAQTIGTHPVYIEGLKTLVYEHLDRLGAFAAGGEHICPSNNDRCCMRSYEAMA